jgi:hypothetical protein
MLKVITGQRDQLERKLIEEICLGDLRKADELTERLKIRSSLSLVDNLKADQQKPTQEIRE